LVDNQGFNLAVAKVLRSLSVPVVFYFPPQIWIGPFLFARSVARNSRLVISAFPLEAEIYRDKYGANAVSFGHPLLDIAKPSADSDAVLSALGLDPRRPMVGLMPGSRPQEVKILVRPMLEAAKFLRERHPSLQFVLPIAAGHLKESIEAEVRAAGAEKIVRLIEREAYTALSRCQVVLACSALKEAYRSRLMAGLGTARLVFLRGDFESIRARVQSRQHKYMPASLLQSQFDTLEPPANALEIDATLDLSSAVQRIAADLATRGPARTP
ncbi:MAG: hypothetical protein EBS65_06290, partial [Betaproteobacteria bacterium]|nr:hypothetical protein [Betaproteobacteria bacterium]